MPSITSIHYDAIHWILVHEIVWDGNVVDDIAVDEIRVCSEFNRLRSNPLLPPSAFILSATVPSSTISSTALPPTAIPSTTVKSTIIPFSTAPTMMRSLCTATLPLQKRPVRHDRALDVDSDSNPLLSDNRRRYMHIGSESTTIDSTTIPSSTALTVLRSLCTAILPLQARPVRLKRALHIGSQSALQQHTLCRWGQINHSMLAQ